MKLHHNIIIGATINFRKVTDADLKILASWRNTKGIREYNNQFMLLNMVQQKEWFKQINAKDSDRIMFMVTNKKNKPIGVCGLIHIDKINRNADVAIILGEQKLHGRGLGSEILSMLIDYGFNQLKLHRIGAEIFSYNNVSIKLFEKLAFKREVTLHEALWRNGKWWNIYVFSLLKHEQKTNLN